MRVPIPTGGSIRVVSALASRKGFSIQNVGAVDLYYSNDQRQLDSVDGTNLPTVGHILAASAPIPPPVVYPFYVGEIFIRAQAVGGLAEITVYDVDVPCKG
jgi:hypothetical protein